MRSKKVSMGMTAAFAAIIVTLLMTDTRADAQASIVYDFTGANGSSPQGGVSFDKSGNIYGTTIEVELMAMARSSNCRHSRGAVGRNKSSIVSISAGQTGTALVALD